MLTCDRTIAIYFIVLSVQTRTRNFVRRCIKDGQRNHDKIESMFVIKITFLDYTLFFYLFLFTYFLFAWIFLDFIISRMFYGKFKCTRTYIWYKKWKIKSIKNRRTLPYVMFKEFKKKKEEIFFYLWCKT